MHWAFNVTFVSKLAQLAVGCYLMFVCLFNVSFVKEMSPFASSNSWIKSLADQAEKVCPEKRSMRRRTYESVTERTGKPLSGEHTV